MSQKNIDNNSFISTDEPEVVGLGRNNNFSKIENLQEKNGRWTERKGNSFVNQ